MVYSSFHLPGSVMHSTSTYAAMNVDDELKTSVKGPKLGLTTVAQNQGARAFAVLAVAAFCVMELGREAGKGFGEPALRGGSLC
jgi:hypothetical protein